MKTKFVNKKRVCGTTIEGHGEYQTRHNSYEIKCPDCGKWSPNYGEYSETVHDIETGEEHQRYICTPCGKRNWDAMLAEGGEITQE